MTDFKIKRGMSTTMFTAPGVINHRLIIEEGTWYLCIDTAELYLGTLDTLGQPTLKRINEVAADATLKDAIEKLYEQIAALENIELFKRIEAESDLPTDFNSEDFNPNVTYYIPLTENRVSTYIFDNDLGSYICTNSIDDTIINAMVAEAIDNTLEGTLATKLPDMIKSTVTGSILYGGDASTENV